MATCVLSLSGEPLKGDGLENADTIGKVRLYAAAAMGCSVSSIKLVLVQDGKDTSEILLKDEHKLEELPSKTFTAIKQTLDPSLVELASKETSEFDEGQTDFYKTSTLSYGDTVIWSTSSHRACHIGGWGLSTHVAELSADKTVLVVMSGCVQRKSGDLYPIGAKFEPKREEINVEELVMCKGLI